MANVNITIRMDENVKRNFETFCEDIGMSMSTAINIFAKKAISEYRIPFEVSAPKPNKATLQAMSEVERMKQDPTHGKSYNTVEDTMEDSLNR